MAMNNDVSEFSQEQQVPGLLGATRKWEFSPVLCLLFLRLGKLEEFSFLKKKKEKKSWLFLKEEG
jgi:hypothetical protein